MLSSLPGIRFELTARRRRVRKHPHAPHDGDVRRAAACVRRRVVPEAAQLQPEARAGAGAAQRGGGHGVRAVRGWRG